jgi:4-hydroxybenzoate polyprenyltransferase
MIHLFKSLRWINAVFVALAVFAAYQKWVAHSFQLAFELALVVFFGVLFSNALNNFLDYESDVANQKYPSVTLKQRGWSARILGVISLLIIPTFSVGHLSSALYFLWFMGVAYNLIQTKNKGWWGGIMVAFCLSFTLMLPFWSDRNFSLSTFFQKLGNHDSNSVEFLGYFLIVFALSTLREYLKDYQDAAGDQKFNKKTWAPYSNLKVFKVVVLGLSVLLWFGLAHLYILEKDSVHKLFWIFLPAFSFPFLISNFKGKLPKQASFYQKYLKIFLFAGVLTLFL